MFTANDALWTNGWRACSWISLVQKCLCRMGVCQ